MERSQNTSLVTTYLSEQDNKKNRQDLINFVTRLTLTAALVGGSRLLIGEGAECLTLLIAAIPWGIAVARRVRL